jgi:hypothetical protein
MRHLFGILAGLAILSAARAVTIDIDYSYDSSGFFTANPEARSRWKKPRPTWGRQSRDRCRR